MVSVTIDIGFGDALEPGAEDIGLSVHVGLSHAPAARPETR